MIPFSRRNPQFNQRELANSLEVSDVEDRHLPALGGR
ncbi:MAG: hypothetical protein KC643_11755 [Nitrospira sp.]|nr:hypothetical protein [Nitrospira sp.]